MTTGSRTTRPPPASPACQVATSPPQILLPQVRMPRLHHIPTTPPGRGTSSSRDSKSRSRASRAGNGGSWCGRSHQQQRAGMFFCRHFFFDFFFLTNNLFYLILICLFTSSFQTTNTTCYPRTMGQQMVNDVHVIWANGNFFLFRFYYTNMLIYFIFLVSIDYKRMTQPKGRNGKSFLSFVLLY
jgi:hypothetical protein